MSEISDRIKQAIERSGKTQRQIAEEVGVTAVSMSNYVSGQRMPRAKTLVSIAKVCNVSEMWLLTGRQEHVKHIEMIIDYITDGSDFQYNDNKGMLIRCKDCLRVDPANCRCLLSNLEVHELDYCSKAVKA